MSGGDLHHVLPVDLRRHDPGLHGGHRVRQDDPAQAPNADVTLLEAGGHLSTGRGVVLHVPGWGHAQESHHRGEHPGAVDPDEVHQGGRGAVAVPVGVGRWGGRVCVGFVLHLAADRGAPD
uniref:(northern house mosquito) hypothetical protein n=1 Tax=Culex pipiens TaxID=7175 RepID=A0A8D8H668_CULPI